jgi:hypothetical protein
MMADVKVAVAMLALLLVACSSDASPSPTPEPEPAAESWLAMGPEDVRIFDGPGGELLLIYVDETYSVGDVNASALTWKQGNDYTTDYFVEDDSGDLWWYGRRGEWRATRNGPEPRLVLDHATADARTVVEFGDIAVTMEQGIGPVEVTTPLGDYQLPE